MSETNVAPSFLIRSPASRFYMGTLVMGALALDLFEVYLSQASPADPGAPTFSDIVKMTLLLLLLLLVVAVWRFWRPRVRLTDEKLEAWGAELQSFVVLRSDILGFVREREKFESRIVVRTANGESVTLDPLSLDFVERKLPFMVSWQSEVFDQLESWAQMSPLPEA